MTNNPIPQIWRRFVSTAAVWFLVGLFAVAHAQIPAPEDIIGFQPGEDYVLADNTQLEDYYRALADASDRIELTTIGQTHRGRDLLLMYISSSENLGQLDRWREISERLARARDLDDDEARELAREGKAVVWIDAGLHSAELAHSQHGPHLAHHLATDESDETLRILDDVVLLFMPVMNPDGHDVQVGWYRSQAETPFAESSPPYLWHEYVDHDNNRDWFMLLQNESRAVAQVLYNEWYPQIVVNHHQMGEMPARMFIPPFQDPVNPHIPGMVVRGTNLVGEHMANRFAQEGKSGIVQRMTFNMWWNGGMRTAPYFHNMVGILTESTHRSPIPRKWEEDDIPDQITRGGVTIPMKEPSVFYPDPWEGGWANMMQMVEYHKTASMGVLDVASLRKQDWLYNIYQMGRDAIASGEEGGPFAYVVPEDQWDKPEAAEMLRVLRRGGLEIHRATSDFTADDETYAAGSYVLYAGQAFKPYLRDLMEPQTYPERRLYPGGPPEPPYDMAGWTLPIQMGVAVSRIDEPFDASVEEVTEVPAPASEIAGGGDAAYVLSSRSNFAARAVNRLFEEGYSIRRAAEPFSTGGEDFEAGSFIVESQGQGTQNLLGDIGDELGLSFRGVDSAPDVESYAFSMPSIAMYKPFTRNIDEGWTRWVFDNYEFPVDTLYNEDIRNGALSEYDVFVMPAQNPDQIRSGRSAGSVPDQYVGGLGARGVVAIEDFAQAGGTVVAWDGATDFLIDQLNLPVRNRVGNASQSNFFIPGSLVQLNIDTTHPLGFGMQEEQGAFFVTRRGSQSRSFQIIEPASAEDRTADPPAVEPFAWYADDDVLLSGWALGEDRFLAGNPAAVRAQVGDGQVILIGVRPQFRAQPRGTFKFIFNSLYASTTEELPRVQPAVAADEE